jgi:phosphate transport system permease protein
MIVRWFKSGNPWIWLTASAVSVSMILVFGLIVLIAVRGLGHFWPSDILDLQYSGKSGQVRLIGEIHDEEVVPIDRLREAGLKIEGEGLVTRYLLKTGNRDITGLDFRWIVEPMIQSRTDTPDLMAIERREWGNFYGELVDVRENGKVIATQGNGAWAELQNRLERSSAIFAEIRQLEKVEIGAINYGLERVRLKERGLELDHDNDPAKQKELSDERAKLQSNYKQLQTRLRELYTKINRDSIAAIVADGRTSEIPLAKIVRAYRPNSMSLFGKIGFYFAKVWCGGCGLFT